MLELQDETITDYVDRIENELGDIKVPGTQYSLLDYVHGRCHIWAESLHREAGLKMESLWDVDAWVDGCDEPTSVLVHAYCHNANGEMIDARGLLVDDVLEYSFEYSEAYYEETTLEILNKDIEKGILFAAEENEIKSIRNFIRLNIDKYK